MPELPPPTAAIIVAGGRGARMGGIDKPGLDLGGRSLRARAIAAARAAGCAPVVHVGAEVDGGPVTALAAGLDHLSGADAVHVLVLAGDLVRPERVIAALAVAAGPRALLGRGGPAGALDGRVDLADDHRDGVVLVDPDGRPQWLAGRYRIGALRAALARLPGGARNASWRALAAALVLDRFEVDAEVVADIDTWQDYEHAKGQFDG